MKAIVVSSFCHYLVSHPHDYGTVLFVNLTAVGLLKGRAPTWQLY